MEYRGFQNNNYLNLERTVQEQRIPALKGATISVLYSPLCV